MYRGKYARLVAYVSMAWLLAALSGCNAPAARRATSNGGERAYLETLNQLTTAAPDEQAAVFAAVETNYNANASVANSLRYAAALAVSGHPAANLARGKALLEKLLAEPNRLNANERNLAAFLLKNAEHRLRLEAENRRLLATVDERTRGQANLDRRAQSLAEDNARLRKQLEEVQRKLDAIVSIERSSIERRAKPASPTNRSAPTSDAAKTQSAPDGR